MKSRKRIDTPCQLDPELWFSEQPADMAEAKAACGTCNLFAACDAAIADIERGQRSRGWGIWAGKTPRERQEHAKEGAA